RRGARAAESASAAESNSLQPRVPAIAASPAMSSFAPGCEGGSPSSLITVARTTSSPAASRRASSSSTLGMRSDTPENPAQDLHCASHLIVGGGVAGGQAQAPERLLHGQAHRQQDVRGIERAGGTRRSARGRDTLEVEGEQHVLAPTIGERACCVIGQALL